MPKIAEASIREVQERLDALAVVGDYVRLDRKGGRWWGCCPFHSEKTPSFTLDPDRKFYYCFGCHKGGSIINFVMDLDKLSFPEAIERLARKSGVEIVYEGGEEGGNREENAKKAAQREALYELYRRVAGSFHYFLTENTAGREALAYIRDRGISEAMIKTFNLGYTPADRSWLHGFLSGKGYSLELLAASGLFSAKFPRSAFFSDRLMFPIADREGRTVAFGGRLLAGEGPKYLNSNESEIYKKGKTLFAIDRALPEIRRTKLAYIAEGYLDVLALHQAGVTNAVAPLGTAFTEDQARLLRRWADRLCLIFDADEAGQAAAEKAILTCRRNGLAASVLIPGQGIPQEGEPIKDPADILKKLGAQTLQNSLKCSIVDFEYLIHRIGHLFDCSGPEEKARAAAYLFPYMETLDSEVEREARIGDLADALGADRQAVAGDFARHDRRLGPSRVLIPPKVPEDAPAKPVMNDELFLLVAVFVNHGLYPKLRSTLSIEEFEDIRARELYIALEEWFRNEIPGESRVDGALLHSLLTRIGNEALRIFVLEQAASGAFTQEPEKLFAESVRRVKQKVLERRQTAIVIELRTKKWGGPDRGLEELLAEKLHIDAALRSLKELSNE